MSDEVELKLDLTRKAAARVEKMALLAGQPAVLRLRSIYFDTPALALAKAGLSLRIRRAGDTLTQTVKADASAAAGLFVRAEWERPVENETPILDDTSPIQAIVGATADTLTAVFEVLVERRIWNIRYEGAEIELAIDRGEAVAGDRSTAICEIELELKSGDVAALFGLARTIGEVAPVRVAAESKADRGRRLSRSAVTAVKAGPVGLDETTTAAQAYSRIVQNCVVQYRLNEELLRSSRNPAALHQMRVALRRLRSALASFGNVLDIATCTGVESELRWLNRELGTARNLDVMLERTDLGRLREPISAARETAHHSIDQILASARVRRLFLDVVASTVPHHWASDANTDPGEDEPVRDMAADVLRGLYRKLKKHGKAITGPDDKARHKVRKDAKKLRYVSEFFAGAFAKRPPGKHHKKFAKALESLLDALGKLNDVTVVPLLLSELRLTDEPDAARIAGDDKRDKLLKQAANAYKQLIGSKPYWR